MGFCVISLVRWLVSSIVSVACNTCSWEIPGGNEGDGWCVAFVSLDEVCRNKEIYLMHLDIEGYEINAINSGKETIKTTSHLILEYEHIGLDKIKNILSLDKFEYEVLDAGDVYLKNLGWIVVICPILHFWTFKTPYLRLLTFQSTFKLNYKNILVYIWKK